MSLKDKIYLYCQSKKKRSTTNRGLAWLPSFITGPQSTLSNSIFEGHKIFIELERISDYGVFL